MQPSSRPYTDFSPPGHPSERPKDKFVVINVAQSFAKLNHESALIAASVIAEADTWLDMLRNVWSRKSKLRIGIVGYGTIGIHIVKMLQESGCLEVSGIATELLIYDKNRSKTSLAYAQGLRIAGSLQEVIEGSDVLICATGGNSIDGAAAQYLKDGTVLISASSGDHEFRGLNRWSLEAQPVCQSLGPVPGFDSVHGLVVATSPEEDRCVYIVNGGFPVNFTGGLEPIAADRIQLTRGLMYGGVMQALGAADERVPRSVGSTGEFYLSATLDSFVLDKYQELLRAGDPQAALVPA